MDFGASTRLRNGPHGYGLVTKFLHWATVVLLLAQFVVGYVMAGRAAAAAGPST
jgi:cytochrome b561